MSETTIVGLSGSYSSPSKTRALVEAATVKAARTFGRKAAIFDLTDFGPELGFARRLSDLGREARHTLDQLLEAEALVVASPVYKGSYTGLFKHLVDLLEPTALVGKPVLLAATGGGDKHALIIEHQLRPLFGFLEAQTLPTGIYASERDFTDGVPTAPALLERLDRAVAQFTPFLGDPLAGSPSPATDPFIAQRSLASALSDFRTIAP